MDKDIWINPFLQALAHSGIVAEACKITGVSRNTVMSRYARDVDFAAGFDEAMDIAVDMAEKELWRRAIQGVDEPITYKGRISYETEEYIDEETGEVRERFARDERGRPIPLTVNKRSDALLMFLLKGRRKQVYADRTELTGAGGEPLQLDDAKKAARVAALMAAAQARRDQATAMEQLAREHGDIA